MNVRLKRPESLIEVTVSYSSFSQHISGRSKRGFFRVRIFGLCKSFLSVTVSTTSARRYATGSWVASDASICGNGGNIIDLRPHDTTYFTRKLLVGGYALIGISLCSMSLFTAYTPYLIVGSILTALGLGIGSLFLRRV